MKTSYLLLLSVFCTTQIQAFNFPRQPTKSYTCDSCAKLSHDNLHQQWQITEDALNPKVSNAQKSFGYRQTVSAQDLRKGVQISTLAPGAVIRLTSLQNTKMPELLFKTPTKKVFSLKEVSALYTEDEGFSAGLNSAKNQTILQLKPELGAGTFVVQSRNSTASNESYTLSVLDKFSTTYLQVETDALHYQNGDTLTATIALNDSGSDYSIDEIQTTIIGPAGQRMPIKLTELAPNVFEGSVKLNSESNDLGENWYVEAQVSSSVGSTIIKRSGHTAFSYAVTSASVISIRKISSKPLTFVATLDIATASRYSLQSVLYRNNGKGVIKPQETSQTARWLEPGKQIIQFSFDNPNHFADDTLYLGYVRLVDYGQLKTVYQFNQPLKLSQFVE